MKFIIFSGFIAAMSLEAMEQLQHKKVELQVCKKTGMPLQVGQPNTDEYRGGFPIYASNLFTQTFRCDYNPNDPHDYSFSVDIKRNERFFMVLKAYEKKSEHEKQTIFLHIDRYKLKDKIVITKIVEYEKENSNGVKMNKVACLSFENNKFIKLIIDKDTDEICVKNTPRTLCAAEQIYARLTS